MDAGEAPVWAGAIYLCGWPWECCRAAGIRVVLAISLPEKEDLAVADSVDLAVAAGAPLVEAAPAEAGRCANLLVY